MLGREGYNNLPAADSLLRTGLAVEKQLPACLPPCCTAPACTVPACCTAPACTVPACCTAPAIESHLHHGQVLQRNAAQADGARHVPRLTVSRADWRLLLLLLSAGGALLRSARRSVRAAGAAGEGHRGGVAAGGGTGAAAGRRLLNLLFLILEHGTLALVMQVLRQQRSVPAGGETAARTSSVSACDARCCAGGLVGRGGQRRPRARVN